MSYSVNKKNGTISVNEGTLNTDTSLQLVGKDYFGYGEAVAQSFVDLLQNFASNTAPANPIEGQLWFDTNLNYLKIWNATTNDDTVGSWLSIDPSASGPTSVMDSTSTMHDVWVTYQNGQPVATFSSEADFAVHSSDSLYAYFPNIKTGVTLSNATNMKFHGTATTAEYADLAEMYSSDVVYEAGTVVKLGGSAEVTQTTVAYDENVFGIVSTDPAYLMNSAMEGTVVPVALAGRVPCKVSGPVNKGDRLVSSMVAGTATSANSDTKYTQVIGRALEDKATEEVSIIEVVVGVK